MIWSCDTGQRISCFEYPVSLCESLCDLMFTKPAWLRSAYLRDVVAAAADVEHRTRPRAIPLAMLTMKKESLGFHNLYAWFSSVSPISIGIVLRFPALRACEAPLKIFFIVFDVCI